MNVICLQAKVRVEFLENEHTRVLEMEQRQAVERRARAKRHHEAMIEKFKAEGIYR